MDKKNMFAQLVNLLGLWNLDRQYGHEDPAVAKRIQQLVKELDEKDPTSSLRAELVVKEQQHG